MIEVEKDPRFGNTNALVLFENPLDVLRVIEGGVDIKEVNVGSMAHSTGKVVVNKVLSMGREDVGAFEKMKAKGIHFDVRKVPNDSRANMDDILKKRRLNYRSYIANLMKWGIIMSTIEIILVILIAFLAGMEGILDEFQFHQPLVACTLIGLVTGNLEAGIVLGGTLQMIALGWANIGAAVAPDAALASVASAIILVLGGQGVSGVASAIAVAVPLAVAGLF